MASLRQNPGSAHHLLPAGATETLQFTHSLRIISLHLGLKKDSDDSYGRRSGPVDSFHRLTAPDTGNHAQSGGEIFRMRRSLLSLMILCSIFATGPALGLSNPDDFCLGDPCFITSDKTADAGITLDFGSRSVVLSRVLTIDNLPTGAVGSLIILAGNFSIIGDGQIKGNGGSNQAGTITIDVPGDIRVDGTRFNGAFRMAGSDGGTVILTAGGNVFGSGRFNLNSDGLLAGGGELFISAGGSIDLSGELDSRGGLQGFAGSVDLTAVGDITISGKIDLNAGESGGSLDVFSEGSITVGEIDMSARGEVGDAGLADLLAFGDLTITHELLANGADNGENCGDAGDLDLTADGALTISNGMRMKGRGLDCSGGFLTVDGGTVAIAGEIDLAATGTEGFGGEVDISSTALMTISGDIHVEGADGAGDVLIFSDGNIWFFGDLFANGYREFGSGASLIAIDSGGTLAMLGSIDASGGSSGFGGDVALDACSIAQGAGSTIDVSSMNGLISLLANESVHLDGTFIGEPTAFEGIEIRYGALADPPDIADATFNFPPTLNLDPTLQACALCNSNLECDDSNPCTDDLCVPTTGCQNTANTAPCNDGNVCTTADTCAASACVPGPPVVCNDGNECTTDSCDPVSGCDFAPNSEPCDDGDACTENDTCSASACSGTPIDCEDGNPCTDDTCSAGACQSLPNTDPCEDGDSCTLGDVCSGGSCQPGTPEVCQDSDPCTIDSCDAGLGCVFDPIVGCADSDGDGIVDSDDHCTTLDWSVAPLTPPDQHPSKLRLTLKNIGRTIGTQGAIFKGFFNVAAPAQVVEPEVTGIHFSLTDSAGLFYDISIPGGLIGEPQHCDARDGWKVVPGVRTRWKYSNVSDALPPTCTPGSARGLAKVQIKDKRGASKSALQTKLKVKNGNFDRNLTLPLDRIQVDFALGAQPAPGTASTQAIDGQCAEGLITGTPIGGASPKPFCKQRFRDGSLDKVICKGN